MDLITPQYANMASAVSGEVITGIYAIESEVNGKIYIGQAVDIDTRWRSHRRELREGKHHSNHLQKAWNKHGEAAFIFRVIVRLHIEDLNIEEVTNSLTALEQQFVDRETKRRGWRKLYNAHVTCVRSPLGIKQSDATRQKKKEYANRPEVLERSRQLALKRWANPEFAASISAHKAAQANDPNFVAARAKTNWPEGVIGILWHHEESGRRILSSNVTRTTALLGINRSQISMILNGKGRNLRTAKGWAVRYVLASEDITDIPVLPVIPTASDLPW